MTRREDVGFYSVMVSNAFGSTTSRVAGLTLNLAGTLDAGFYFTGDATTAVHSVAVQPDGKILAGGSFKGLGSVLRTNMVRLNPDGTIDSDFDAQIQPFAVELPFGIISEILPGAGNKLLIAGQFSSVGGTRREGIARLNGDGFLDEGFDAGELNAWLMSLVEFADGRLLIGGQFNSIQGVPRRSIARLNNDGSLDVDFATSDDRISDVKSMVVQPNAYVVAAGSSVVIDHPYLARFRPDGSLDTSFNPVVRMDSGNIGRIDAVILEPDGKLIIVGTFALVNGTARRHIARLSPEGTLDTDFAQGSGADSPIRAAVRQPDGKVIIGGFFDSVHGGRRRHIARLNPDGTLDPAFNPTMDPPIFVEALALEPDGDVIVGGSFVSGSTSVAVVTRIYGDQLLSPPRPAQIITHPASQTVVSGSTVTFAATVAGSEPLILQWSKGGMLLPNATNTVLVLTNVARAFSGYYSLSASNAQGSATSSNALLRVLVPQRFFMPELSANGDLRFRFGDYDGGLLLLTNSVNFEVHASTNLANWQPVIGIMSITNGQILFEDTDSARFFSRRFYRIIEK